MKHWKPIVSILAIVLVAVLVVGVFLHFSVPKLSQKEKEKVEQEYNENGDGKVFPIVWYDENGHVEEPYVWRYIGKYGDCYAFLKFGSGLGATGQRYEGFVVLYGLSRQVYYPVDADVVLFHTKRTFTYTYTDVDASVKREVRWVTLESLGEKQRQEWLTDKQLEKLTRDVEKIAKEHN